MGNSGAGKTTLSRALQAHGDAACLSLDEVAFANGAERRPLSESVADVRSFMAAHGSWIIEGCYADLIEPLLQDCETLVFLNPGVATCVEHCRQRPWEPDKYDSAAEQDQNLERLLGWVAEYDTRTDEYGLQEHRRLFDSFPGRKFEFTGAATEAARRILAAQD